MHLYVPLLKKKNNNNLMKYFDEMYKLYKVKQKLRNFSY